MKITPFYHLNTLFMYEKDKLKSDKVFGKHPLLSILKNHLHISGGIGA